MGAASQAAQAQQPVARGGVLGGPTAAARRCEGPRRASARARAEFPLLLFVNLHSEKRRPSPRLPRPWAAGGPRARLARTPGARPERCARRAAKRGPRRRSSRRVPAQSARARARGARARAVVDRVIKPNPVQYSTNCPSARRRLRARGYSMFCVGSFPGLCRITRVSRRTRRDHPWSFARSPQLDPEIVSVGSVGAAAVPLRAPVFFLARARLWLPTGEYIYTSKCISRKERRPPSAACRERRAQQPPTCSATFIIDFDIYINP